MSDMKNILTKLAAIESKKTLTESALAECGPDMAPPASNPGTPVTASITLNASGMENVADLMDLIKNAGLAKQGPEPAPTMPMQQDMARLKGAVSKIDAPSIDLAIAPKEEKVGEWSNEPDEQYADHKLMTKDLSGGLNREKKMHKPAADGDNPMAVESIKARLYTALEEAKKKAKPDYIDADNDGNEKEPMTKALADKKKNPFAKKK